MNFEKQATPAPEGEDTRLGPDEAHEEANMIHLKAEGKGTEGGPTPEDYDRALEELEELKTLAAEGPKGVEKLKERLKQLIVAGVSPIVALGGIFNQMLSSGEKGMVKETLDDVDGLADYFVKGGPEMARAKEYLEQLRNDAQEWYGGAKKEDVESEEESEE